MSLNHKRQSKSSLLNRWNLNKSRTSSKVFSDFRQNRRKQTHNQIYKQKQLSPLTRRQKETITPFQQNQHNLRPIIQYPKRAYSSLTQIPENPEHKYQSLNINLLQSKIDLLLKEKLKILINFNKHKLLSKAKDIPIDISVVKSLLKLNMQLESLVMSLRSNLDLFKNNQNIQKWVSLDQRIKMLEKVMAENYSEAQLMKKFYTKVSHSGTSYKNFCKEREDSEVNKIKDRHLRLIKQKVSMSLSPNKRLPFLSENKKQYKCPHKSNYKTPKRSHTEYSKREDQSIIQSSAYKISYRQYPKFDIPPTKQRLSSLSFNPYVKEMQSSYKKDYMNHQKSRDQMPHYKKLDCYRNKIRSLDLSYLKQKNSIDSLPCSINQNIEYIRLNREINKTSTQPEAKLTKAITSTISTYTPISSTEQQLYRAQPKNNRLQNLKSSFRQIYVNQ